MRGRAVLALEILSESWWNWWYGRRTGLASRGTMAMIIIRTRRNGRVGHRVGGLGWIEKRDESPALKLGSMGIDEQKRSTLAKRSDDDRRENYVTRPQGRGRAARKGALCRDRGRKSTDLCAFIAHLRCAPSVVAVNQAHHP